MSWVGLALGALVLWGVAWFAGAWATYHQPPYRPEIAPEWKPPTENRALRATPSATSVRVIAWEESELSPSFVLYGDGRWIRAQSVDPPRGRSSLGDRRTGTLAPERLRERLEEFASLDLRSTPPNTGRRNPDMSAYTFCALQPDGWWCSRVQGMRPRNWSGAGPIPTGPASVGMGDSFPPPAPLERARAIISSWDELGAPWSPSQIDITIRPRGMSDEGIWVSKRPLASGPQTHPTLDWDAASRGRLWHRTTPEHVSRLIDFAIATQVFWYQFEGQTYKIREVAREVFPEAEAIYEVDAAFTKVLGVQAPFWQQGQSCVSSPRP